MIRRVRTCLSKLHEDDGGNLTFILALASTLIIGVTGLAVDTSRIVNARTKTQEVADAAALAAAAAKVPATEKQKIALAFAKANLTKIYGVTATPAANVSGKTVSVAIKTTVRGTFLAVLFPQSVTSNSDSGVPLPAVNFTVKSKTLAEPGASYVPCILALNTSMAYAVYIRGTGDFLADKCSVMSNSTSATGMTFQGNANAKADAFLSAGGYQKIGNSGTISPQPIIGVAQVADPLNKAVSDPGGTSTSPTIKKQSGNVSLSAMKYANITIQAQGQATFTPGSHYITGTLSLGSQAVLNGTGVTLVLLGPNAKIDMNSGGTLKLTAPTSGTYPGYAVIGDNSNTTVLTNTIQGGASGYVRGIWYTPKHKLYVTGNGDFNIGAGYFAVVVDNIEIGGDGQFQMGFDWQSGGYPQPSALKIVTQSKVSLTN